MTHRDWRVCGATLFTVWELWVLLAVTIDVHFNLQPPYPSSKLEDYLVAIPAAFLFGVLLVLGVFTVWHWALRWDES
jgi:hypothetical protein